MVHTVLVVRTVLCAAWSQPHRGLTRARDQDLPQFATLLTDKATLAGGVLTAHNITSAELSTLATAAAAGYFAARAVLDLHGPGSDDDDEDPA